MAVTLEGFENTFYPFADQSGIFVSDRECAYQRTICLPIYDNFDVSILFKLTITDISIEDPTSYLDASLYNACSGGDEYPCAGGLCIDPVFTILYSQAVTGGTEYYIRLSWPDGWTYEIDAGECIHIKIFFDYSPELKAQLCSSCFYKVDDQCFTTKIWYRNFDDAFGIPYSLFTTEFNHVVRLPMWLGKPQYPKTGEYYERSNGEKVTLFARFNRQYEVFSDDLNEWQIKNLLVAISHDFVKVFPEELPFANGFEVVSNNDFEIEWPDMGVSSANWGRPRFNLLETPFVEINNNCQ
jgi:hypothetical protein